MLLKIKSRVNLLDDLLISTPLIDQISIGDTAFFVWNRKGQKRAVR